MIKYQLKCPRSHEFEGWFRNSAEFDDQSDQGLLSCPACGSHEVSKAIMAPAIARNITPPSGARAPEPTGQSDQPGPTPRAASPVMMRDDARLAAMRQDIIAAAERARKYVEKNFDYVGRKFPEEARKIHYGEVEERAIFGEATDNEARELIDEGVSVAPLKTPRQTETTSQAARKKMN